MCATSSYARSSFIPPSPRYGYNAAIVYCLPDKKKSYTEILRQAAFSDDAPNYYKVLNILTADGDFDMQETTDAIVAIAKVRRGG